MRRRRSASAFRVGLSVLVVGAVVIFLAVTKDIPFLNEPYVVKAAFSQSSGIRAGSPVRIAGVDVGKVTKVEHAGAGSEAAVLTLALTKKGLPVHRDARAAIRPRIFLEGNFFVDLQPGSPSSPSLDRDATLPVAQTDTPVQFDQILKALNADVRANLRETFAELMAAQEAGAGKALNASLNHQPAAYRFSAIVSDALLGERPHDLGDLIRDQGIVASALDQDPQALMGLVTNLNTTLAALGDNEGALRRALAELPRTLGTGVRTFAALDRAFPPLRRFARAAVAPVRATGPAARAVTPLVTQLTALAGDRELGGLTGALREATPPATVFSRRSVGLLSQLRALSSCTDRVLVPWGEDTVPDPNFKATGPVHEEVPKSLVGLAGESRSHDANGQWFKILGSAGPQTLDLGHGLLGTTGTQMQGVNPPPQRSIPPLRPDVPCETQDPPDLRTHAGDPPPTRRTDPGSARATRRAGLAEATAVRALRRELHAAGSKLNVSSTPATRAQVRAMAARAKARRAP